MALSLGHVSDSYVQNLVAIESRNLFSSSDNVAAVDNVVVYPQDVRVEGNEDLLHTFDAAAIDGGNGMAVDTSTSDMELFSSREIMGDSIIAAVRADDALQQRKEDIIVLD